jgi:hypothetical protein
VLERPPDPPAEIFGPTIQGEGPFIGRPTVFVRPASCDSRCNWCDTLYAVLREYRDEWLKICLGGCPTLGSRNSIEIPQGLKPAADIDVRFWP